MARIISYTEEGVEEKKISYGFYTVGFLNIGSGDALVDGQPLPAGTAFTPPRIAGETYEEDLTYNPQGNKLIIREIR